MTNPNDSVGTNGAYGGRTSVNAINDVLASFSGRGIISGWNTTVSSGMTLSVGGSAGLRDVAIAEDNAGNRTTIDNRSSSPIAVEIAAASSSTQRIDCVVAYVNNPPTVLVTTIDNPTACGIIAVQGTSSAPTESAIRDAITADGGTGSTAYYVVLATVTVPAGATDLSNNNVAQGSITSSNVDWATQKSDILTPLTSMSNNNTFMVTLGSMRILYLNCRPTSALTASQFYNFFNLSVTPTAAVSTNIPTLTMNNGATVEVTAEGITRFYLHGSGTYGNWIRAIIPFFVG